MADLHIPEITDVRLKQLYSRIKPVMKKAGSGELYWLREFSDDELRHVAYTWGDNFDRRVPDGTIAPIKGKDFRCLHRYGFQGFFKPSIAEVLAQIDPRLLGVVVAFEIIKSPSTEADLRKDPFTSAAFNEGFHVSTVRLYKIA